MREWEVYKLKEICLLITDGSHFSPKVEPAGIPMFSVKDMRDNCFDYSKVKRISEFDYKALIKQGCQPEIGDILIAKDGSVLKHIFKVKSKPDYVLLSSIAIIRPINARVDSNFLSYQLKSPTTSEAILTNFVSGSGVPRIVLKDFKEVDISLPSLPEQTAIAEVLSSLDDKIDLLHRQNKTLEQLAETLFRKWFVEEAEESWEASTIGQELVTVLGGTPSTTKAEYWDGEIPWINSGEVNRFRIDSPTRYITILGLEKSNTKLLPQGTTVIAITGATLGQISLLEIETCANQSVVGIIPNDRLCKEFVFLWVKYKLPDILLNETGGAQPHINKNDVNEAELILPPTVVLNSKIPILRDHFNKISNNISQIRSLTQLRDSLLPKLMSGELRVEEIN